MALAVMAKAEPVAPLPTRGMRKDDADWTPTVSASDRWWFNCFRAVFAFFLLGLIVALYAALLPLFMATPAPRAIATLGEERQANASWLGLGWTEHDSEAARGVLAISTAQACLLLVGYVCFRWRSARGAEAAAARAAGLRRDATRRMRAREKRRVQMEVEEQLAEERAGLLHRRRAPQEAPAA